MSKDNIYFYCKGLCKGYVCMYVYIVKDMYVCIYCKGYVCMYT